MVCSPRDDQTSYGYATFAPRPLVVLPPADVEVRFWYAAPDRWRLDGPDGPVCRTDRAGRRGLGRRDRRDGRGEGSVGRAALGSMAPVSPSLTTRTVHRFDARGATRGVATEVPLDELAAREVVERLALR